MRAVRIESHGGPDVLQAREVPDPTPGPAHALVEVRACGLNHLDIWVRLGGKRRFPLPLIPGSDAAGVIIEAPAGSGLSKGDAVVIYPAEGCGSCAACVRGEDPLCADFRILGAGRDGGLAERIAVSARNCIPKPQGLDFIEAASVPVNWITAWHMLVERARVRPGETVLVQAAGSGVSSAGIQIARLLGARVIATSSTGEKLDHARALGADATINYREEDVAARARELSGGEASTSSSITSVSRTGMPTSRASRRAGGSSRAGRPAAARYRSISRHSTTRARRCSARRSGDATSPDDSRPDGPGAAPDDGRPRLLARRNRGGSSLPRGVEAEGKGRHRGEAWLIRIARGSSVSRGSASTRFRSSASSAASGETRS